MSLTRFYSHWLNIGFYSRFTLPLHTTNHTSTRLPVAARATDSCDGFMVTASTTLCVQETRDPLVEDTFHEAELTKSEKFLMEDSDSDSCKDPYAQSLSKSSEEDDPEFDVLSDNHVLYNWTITRDTLVLDSTTPSLTPHIVITPASDTLGDFTVAWFNQPNYQDAGKLCLPFPDFSENSFNPCTSHPTTFPFPTRSPSAVFSLSRFNEMIDRCSEERLTHFHVVIAVRRQTFKAVALKASLAAMAYRERYDINLPFSCIEPSFSWSDPAEPILLASRHHRATLIIDSPNSFRVPHIIINRPPPEDQWVTAANSIPDPQDCGFGRYLVVHARGVTLVNEPEDAYPGFDSVECENYGASRFDEEEYEEYEEWEGRANEQDDDFGESYRSVLECYSSSFEMDPPELDTESLSSVDSPSPETPDTLDDEDDFKTAFERALEKRASSPQLLSSPSYLEECSMAPATCNPFVDELEPINASPWTDDEDDLPPLDEWYQSVIRRTEGPTAA